MSLDSAAGMEPATPLAVGLDVGTSGVRAVALTRAHEVVAQASVPMPPPECDGPCVTQHARLWADALEACLDALHAHVAPDRVRAVAIAATSGTLLLADATGRPLAPALMYADARAADEARRIAAAAPASSAAHGATSGLAHLLALLREPFAAEAAFALHQADWLAGRLLGRFGDSDENNALKTGYDPARRAWPAWLQGLGVPRRLLPRVHRPGTALGVVSDAARRRHGWRAGTCVVAGTTDGVAAFLATGAQAVGEAVTSLGSTLVVKIVSDTALVAPRDGVYSHRLGSHWLPGGASNAGGAALLQHFSVERMAALAPLLQPERDTGLDYYPLPSVGERFPVADPHLAPRLTPRPADDATFFQGLLEGLAAIEQQGYARLRELGAPPLRSVRTVGGGAANAAWTRIRERRLGVPLLPAQHGTTAAGAARLAMRAMR